MFGFEGNRERPLHAEFLSGGAVHPKGDILWAVLLIETCAAFVHV